MFEYSNPHPNRWTAEILTTSWVSISSMGEFQMIKKTVTTLGVVLLVASTAALSAASATVFLSPEN